MKLISVQFINSSISLFYKHDDDFPDEKTNERKASSSKPRKLRPELFRCTRGQSWQNDCWELQDDCWFVTSFFLFLAVVVFYFRFSWVFLCFDRWSERMKRFEHICVCVCVCVCVWVKAASNVKYKMTKHKRHFNLHLNPGRVYSSNLFLCKQISFTTQQFNNHFQASISLFLF